MICLKAIVVGYGSIGKRHVMNLLSLPNMEVIICSKHAKSDLKLRKKCKVFDSLEECIKEKPDIGFITNYTSHHVKTAIKLANAGIHLFIEKPLADSMHNISALTNLAKKKKLVTKMWQTDKKHKVKHNFTGVQCFNCHNKAVSHPFEAFTEEKAPEAILSEIKGKCIQCHTRDQSPEWYNKDKRGISTNVKLKKFNSHYKKMSCPTYSEN